MRTGWAAFMGLVLAGCAAAEPAWEAGTSPEGLYYEVAGEGPWVVLLHGFSLDGRMWEPQAKELAREYRVVRYDLRGHGRSAGFTGPYASREDLRDVLDAVGAGRVTLVGLSAGAQIAVDFSLSHPDRVEKLVLAAPGLTGYVPKDGFAWLAPVMEAVRAGDASEAARRWAATPLMAIPTNPAGDTLMRTIVADNADLWLEASNPEQVLTPPAIERLSEIDVPTLVVVGEHDLGDTHRVADTLVTCIAGASKRVVPNAGHMVNLAVPDVFRETVETFLRAAARERPEQLPGCATSKEG